MKNGDMVRVVSSTLVQDSQFIGMVGTLQTSYLESLRGYLVHFDNFNFDVPFVPDELKLVEVQP
jgi:hypothetical protein